MRSADDRVALLPRMYVPTALRLLLARKYSEGAYGAGSEGVMLSTPSVITAPTAFQVSDSRRVRPLQFASFEADADRRRCAQRFAKCDALPRSIAGARDRSGVR